MSDAEHEWFQTLNTYLYENHNELYEKFQYNIDFVDYSDKPTVQAKDDDAITRFRKL